MSGERPPLLRTPWQRRGDKDDERSGRGVAKGKLSKPKHAWEHHAAHTPALRSDAMLGRGCSLSSERFRKHRLLQDVLLGEALITSDCQDTLALTALQESLEALGYYEGSKDGVWGSKMSLAVVEFQLVSGLNPNAVICPLTMDILDQLDAKLLRQGNGTHPSGPSGGGLGPKMPQGPQQYAMPRERKKARIVRASAEAYPHPRSKTGLRLVEHAPEEQESVD